MAAAPVLKHLRYSIIIMLLHIEPNLAASDFREHFEECHPRLRMALFTGMKAYRQEHPAPDSAFLRELTRRHDSGIVDVKSWHQAAATSALLKEQYGLIVAFYYRQVGAWVPIPEGMSFAEAEAASEVEEVTGKAEEDEELEGY